MNRTSSIVENCRSILRERCRIFPQQGCPPNTWKPCYPIPTNPIYSPYGVDNLQMPIICCDEQSYYNTLSGLSPTIPSNNYVHHRNTAPMQSENCMQMITNAIITKIRYKIPQEEIALLCCCLPSLIRQIMCKNPWLTPNDIIQCLSTDIIKEAMNCFDQIDLNVKNEFQKPKQDQSLSQQLQENNKFDDNQSHEDDDSLSSYQSTTSADSPKSFLSQHSSRSVLDLPTNIQKKPSKERNLFSEEQKKKNENRSPSTRSFVSQQSKDRESNSHYSLTSSENKSKKSEINTPVHIEEDQNSFSSHNKDSVNSIDSNEDFVQLNPKLESAIQSPRIHIEYPVKKDPNAIQDVEKCLAFYQKIREYFDDDVAAMLFKCCLCYGDCSEKR